jgi:hypothetical protein
MDKEAYFGLKALYPDIQFSDFTLRENPDTQEVDLIYWNTDVLGTQPSEEEIEAAIPIGKANAETKEKMEEVDAEFDSVLLLGGVIMKVAMGETLSEFEQGAANLMMAKYNELLLTIQGN